MWLCIWGSERGDTSLYSWGATQNGYLPSTTSAGMEIGKPGETASSTEYYSSQNSSTKYGPEVKSQNPVRPSEVTNSWDEFLGNGPYTNTGPNATNIQIEFSPQICKGAFAMVNMRCYITIIMKKYGHIMHKMDSFIVSNTWIHIQKE